ncbi:MAG: YihY/virulence factor BrkB family protein [Gammaproteobacteria bacterium]|nr:YihY/virulence factor BrkB family protein [Gammaproteobacteria bacterium]
MLQKAIGKIRAEVWDRDPAKLDWWHARLVRIARFTYAIIRDLAEGQLSLRAMSLVYTTLLSIVPLLAFSFSVLKGFGVHNQVRPFLERFATPLGERGNEVIDNVISFVDKMQVGVLGALGLAFLIYTVISLVQKIEGGFNYVWRVDQPRSIARRFSDYLSVILVGPLLMFSAIGIVASIGSNAVVDRLLEIEPLGSIVLVIGALMPLFLIIAAFSFFYVFVTNTRVRLGSALTGGATAGVLWIVVGFFFRSFVASSTQYAAIYSGFAIVILAMIWVYLNWFILLLGAQIAFYHQHPEFLRIGHRPVLLSNRARERLALLIMYHVGSRHRSSKPDLTPDDLNSQLGLSGNIISGVLSALCKRELVVEADSGALLPGRDSETVSLREIVAAVRVDAGDRDLTRARSIAPVDGVIGEIQSAIDGALSERTLRDLIVEKER